MTEPRKKVTIPTLFKKVADGIPITWLTCYDYPTAYLQEQAGIDMILVGDSLGMTMLGYEITLPVTMDDMIRHTPGCAPRRAERLPGRRYALYELPAQRRDAPSATPGASWPRPLRRDQAGRRRGDGRPHRRASSRPASPPSATWA